MLPYASKSPDKENESYFQHQPLDTLHQQIRLFKLDPNLADDGFLQGSIKHTTLAQDHVCLSYMWGLEDKRRLLRINGQYFEIHQNLYDFLRTAVEHYTSEWMWIDAICIDQSNLRERNHQVGMMGRIYSQAKKTLVYAGLGDWDIELALRDAESWTHSLSIAEIAPKKCTTLFPFAIVRGLWGKHRRGFTALSQLQYWNRAWIKQEILLANNLVFIYWNTHCHWQTIIMIMTGVKSRQRAESDAVSVTLSANPERSLCEHLASFNQLKCADPRDRIFSLLGISKDGTGFPVDYSMSLLQLFVYTLMLPNKWLLLRHSDKAASDSDVESLAVSLDMPKLRDICDLLSLRLFEVEFSILDLTEALQAAESLGLGTWSTAVNVVGMVFQLSCEQEILQFFNALDGNSLDDLFQGDTDFDSSTIQSNFVLIRIEDDDSLFAPSSKFLGLQNACFLCQLSLQERLWKVLGIALLKSFENFEKFDFANTAITALCSIKSPFKVSFSSGKALANDKKFESKSSIEAGPTKVTLQLNVVSLLEVAQVADRLSSRKPKAMDEDPNLDGAFYPGDEKVFR